MKLLYSPTSPYVRKVRVVAREKKLQNRIEEVTSIPFDKEAQLLQANPLGKVPALILDDGSALYDSPVICEYLDSLSQEVQLIPNSEKRWAVLRAQALADGVLDAAVAAVMERKRDSEEQSPDAIQHWQHQICASIVAMADQLDDIDGPLNIGHIAFAVALSYLDFRHNELQWRAQVDKTLVEWHAEFMQRPSMQKTEPPASSITH